MTTHGGTLIMTTEDRAEALNAFAEVLAALNAIVGLSNLSSVEAGNGLAQIGHAIVHLRIGLELAIGGGPADLLALYDLIRCVHLGLELEHTFELSPGMRAAVRAELADANRTLDTLSAALAA